MTDPVPTPAPARRGRGLVIFGGILAGLYLALAVPLAAWFIQGLVTDAGAMSMVFLYWLMAFLALTPLWVAGIALLASGRVRQRGQVRGAVAAWILALGGIPAIGMLLSITISAASGNASAATAALVALAVGIPLLTLLALGSGAWLVWGKPRTP